MGGAAGGGFVHFGNKSFLQCFGNFQMEKKTPKLKKQQNKKTLNWVHLVRPSNP